MVTSAKLVIFIANAASIELTKHETHQDMGSSVKYTKKCYHFYVVKSLVYKISPNNIKLAA